MVKVVKFGGGCFREPKGVEQIIAIIKSSQPVPVVVVSAIHGCTNLLLEILDQALKGKQNTHLALTQIIARHLHLISGYQETVKKRIKQKLRQKLNSLKNLLLGVSLTGEVSPYLQAKIISYGERLTALLLQELLLTHECSAVALETDALGLITDDSPHQASALFPETTTNLSRRLLPYLRTGTVPIVTGFFGRTRNGQITTFGRNGSDYTAAVVARALQAEKLELWKDVPGFLTADPQLEPQAQKIDHLSYFEAAELSYFGAKIVHPRTFEPLLAAPIPIEIKHLHSPHAPGTLISQNSHRSQGVIKSVAANREISLLHLLGPGVGYQPGIIASVGQALADEGINIYSILTSQTRINLLLHQQDLEKASQKLKKFTPGIISSVIREEDIALIGLVGEGLKVKKGIFARVFAAVSRAGVNVEVISAGASEVAYYFIVKDKYLKPAVASIHQEFFGQALSRAVNGTSRP